MEMIQFLRESWGGQQLARGVPEAWFMGILLVVTFNVWTHRSRKRSLLPPGPPGWPVLGHLPSLGTMPHHSLMRMSEKYGPIFSIRLGTQRAIVCSSPDIAKVILKTQDHIFATRPRSINGEVFFYNFQDIALSPYSDRWRLMRKIVDVELFSRKRMKQYEGVRKEEVLATVMHLQEAGRRGQLLELDQEIRRLTFDYTCRLLFSKRYVGYKINSRNHRGELKNFEHLIAEWCSLSGSLFIGDYVPCLRKLDIGGFEAQILQLREQFDQFLSPVIEEHRQKPEAEIKNFLDVLLTLQREKVGDGYPDEQIKALLHDLIMGGTDTSANSIIWALAQVMRNPEIRQKIVDELDVVVGKERLVEESDLDDLKYLKAVVKETFRMHPAVPLGLPREAMQDTQVAGYHIPKGTRVIVNIYAIGRNPKVWKDPNTFNPDRFFGENQDLDVNGQHMELLTFGSGRRICPGMESGRRIVEITLAQILHTCVLSPSPGMEVDLEEAVGITLPKANPIQVLVASRLKPALISEIFTVAP